VGDGGGIGPVGDAEIAEKAPLVAAITTRSGADAK
jgi:hypothetical protein